MVEGGGRPKRLRVYQFKFEWVFGPRMAYAMLIRFLLYVPWSMWFKIVDKIRLEMLSDEILNKIIFNNSPVDDRLRHVDG